MVLWKDDDAKEECMRRKPHALAYEHDGCVPAREGQPDRRREDGKKGGRRKRPERRRRREIRGEKSDTAGSTYRRVVEQCGLRQKRGDEGNGNAKKTNGEGGGERKEREREEGSRRMRP